MENKIPVSVVVATKDEEDHIARCLEALQDFVQIIVLDSYSADCTVEIAREAGAEIVLYAWDGSYPKKRQWGLEHLDLKSDWVFFVDADEVLTPELVTEIRALFEEGVPKAYAGFFVHGAYVWNGKVLRHGMMNNKLALLHRGKMEFPVVDDLDIAGMGEIEGHYQPVLKKGVQVAKIGQIRVPLLHHAYADPARWAARHKAYAHWEAEMTKRGAWPADPVRWREAAKRFLRRSSLRPYVMFFYSYIWKRGFLDGRAGLVFALSRYAYAQTILKELK